MATEILTAPAAEAQASVRHNTEAGDTVRSSWNVSLDDLQKHTSHCSEEAQDLISWCFLWCIDDQHPYRIEEFAQRIGSDSTTISRIIRGRYFRPEPGREGERMQISDKMVRAMASFKKLEIERAQASRAHFVMTPTAKRIFNACDLARESQSPVFVTGPSHIGKTWALNEYTQLNNHGRTIYVRLQAASGLGGMVRAIADALGFSDKQPTAKLIERIKGALRKNRNILLILDEVHQLMYTYRKGAFFSCLEVLREFYDVSQCGMVFCATELLMVNIRNNRNELEQLLRRGVHKVVLPDQPTKGDVDAILAPVGLELPEKSKTFSTVLHGIEFTDSPFEFIRQIGKEEGLKAITERIRYGQKIATKAKAKELSWEHILRAHLIIRQNATAPANDWN